jgi:asparaginyl-tRNA synthetase
VRVATLLKAGEAAVGAQVTVCGWVRTLREQGKGKLVFVEVNDGSTVENLQVVLQGGCPGFEEAVEKANTGASVRVVGEVVASPAKGQTVELSGKEIKVLGEVVDASKYPLAKKGHSREYLREIAHLRPRSNLIGAVARTRATLAQAIHDFFRSRHFQYVHTPLITASDCEGAGEMFQVTTLPIEELIAKAAATPDAPVGAAPAVAAAAGGGDVFKDDFFGRKAFLTVSGQLAVENYACALSDVYTFGPTFRAENSHTSRHLAEFWMIEPEMAFADLADDMACAEEFLKFCISRAMEENDKDLAFFDKFVSNGLIERLKTILAEPFAKMSYTAAIERLIADMTAGKVTFVNKNVYWGMDMDSEHEKYLVAEVNKKPTIVFNYPKTIKPFYMRLNEDMKTVANMDILVPGIGEIIGGSQREERLQVLEDRIKETGMNVEDYWWYLDLRRFGSVPHAGFGLGFERLVMLVTGVDNIRDTIPYPRYPGHAEF